MTEVADMRTTTMMRDLFGAVTILLALCACDKDDQKKALVSSVIGDGGSAAPLASSVSVASAAPKASAAPRPERPIPKGQTMVTSSAPEETQMKANIYLASLKAPQSDDAAVDEAFVNDLVSKLKPILLAMDKGPDKPKWNRVEIEAKGRQIDLFMSAGCDAKAPFNAVAQRANVPLTTLLSHGVLSLRCNDQKIQCYQNVRDQEDVLCTTAPRHK